MSSASLSHSTEFIENLGIYLRKASLSAIKFRYWIPTLVKVLLVKRKAVIPPLTPETNFLRWNFFSAFPHADISVCYETWASKDCSFSDKVIKTKAHTDRIQGKQMYSFNCSFFSFPTSCTTT